MLSMFAERKSYQEIRVRLNHAKGSDEANMLSWSGVRFDEFILTDHEAESLGVPTPTFGEGIVFEPTVRRGLDYTGAVSTLLGLTDGPKVMEHKFFSAFGEFAQWMLRGAFSNGILAETSEWSMYTCENHLHIACQYSNGDVDNYSEKLGFKVYSQLSAEEKAGADEVAEMIVDEIVGDEDLSVFTQFIDTIMSDPDDDEKSQARWN